MNYIRGFNGLRAFSVFFVVSTHIGLYEFLLKRGLYHPNLDVLFSGNTGVQVFFTLSGFLITLILLKEYNKKGSISLKNFYIRRFLRLLPPLIILLCLVSIFMFLKLIPRSFLGLIMSATYTYNFIPLKFYTGELGHTWSLAVEEQFYFLWPMALLVFATTRKRFYVIGAAIGLCIAAAFILRNLSVTNGGEIFPLDSLYTVDRWLFPAIAPIMIGALAASLILAPGNRLLLNFKDKIWPLAAFLFFYVLPVFLPAFLLPVQAIIQSLGIALLLIWIYYNQQSSLCNFLEIKWINYLGKISYGIYIYQGFFLRTGPGESAIMVQYFPYNLLCTILAAIVSYEIIEKPVLKFKTKFA